MKKLYKKDDDKVICGVCGGLAEAVNVDPSALRLLCVLLTCVSGGTALVMYIAAALILPYKSDIDEDK